MTNDREDWLLTAQERGNAATILDERHVDKAAWPAGNKVRADDLAAQGRRLYCVLSSCTAALPETIWRLVTEPDSDYPRPVRRQATSCPKIACKAPQPSS